MIIVSKWHPYQISLQGLTQVEEMLISGVLPIMSLYRLPHGLLVRLQWTCDKPATRCSLFCKHLTMTTLDVIVVRKEGAAESHHDFHVRRSVVLYNVRIDPDAIAVLPEDGDLTGLHSMTLESSDDDQELPSLQDVDPYNAHLARTFVPSSAQRLTE